MDLKQKEKMQELALEYFSSGLNCAESVLKSYFDSSEETSGSELVAFASGFGGGFDPTKCNTCGALVGACLAVASQKGRKNPLEKPTYEERRAQLDNEINPIFRKMSKKFRNEFNSTICGVMCDEFPNVTERRKNCQNAVLFATELVYKNLK